MTDNQSIQFILQELLLEMGGRASCGFSEYYCYRLLPKYIKLLRLCVFAKNIHSISELLLKYIKYMSSHISGGLFW